MTGPVVEIAVQDVAGARLAVAAGADRLELCQALGMGGLTPSIGLIEAVCAAVGPKLVNVLVRPRGGGFVYAGDEVDLVTADIRACVERGVAGVVIGALTLDGLVDREALRRWRDAAAGTNLVFHRAIDASPRPDEVFGVLLEEKVDRVLSSGGEAQALKGVDRLREWVRRADDALEVTAGGGVTAADIPALIRSGISAVHLSARGRAGTAAPAGPGGGSDGHDITDAALVAAAVAAARN